MKYLISISFLTLIFVLLGCNKKNQAPFPEANFYAQNNGCFAPCSVLVFDQSKNAVSWSWSFGNGTSSSSPNDTAFYTTSGNFKIRLVVKNSDEVTDTIVKSISIN
jgi:PKD repeat protein